MLRRRFLPCLSSLSCVLALLLAPLAALAQSTPVPELPPRAPFLIAPTVEGLLLCDEALADPQILRMDAALALCRQKKKNGTPALTRLLDRLEPGGPQGQVQLGYTLTVQLLNLYRKANKADKDWQIDAEQVTALLQLITQVQRPVVLYLTADHFDSLGPIVEELRHDPANLMQLRDGKPLELGYFGYRIMPWTMQTDLAIPVNHYRVLALQYIAQRILALPKPVQNRIAAITLAGELHHMYPDFENGMGRYQDVRVTDYSAASVAGFRQWLQQQYRGIADLNAQMGFAYASFDEVPAPSKDIRKEPLPHFAEHYDAFADGILPLSGWLWDPQGSITQLDLYVDGQRVGPVPRGFNRLDVYRADAAVLSPNVGYRYDFDYSALLPGRHSAQIVAETSKGHHGLAEVEFVVVARDQSRASGSAPNTLSWLKEAKSIPGVRSWLDLPRAGQDLYFNPLARDWNRYRNYQVQQFLAAFHQVAVRTGLPADKLYSHQIVPRANSSWNHQLFAADGTIAGNTPWKQGLNMYGGSTNSDWMRRYLAQERITDYGVPEFHPQQWKNPGVHLAALQSHYRGGARFVSPYYFSLVPERFKGVAEHGVNRMELRPDNPKDGSNQLYQAIEAFARQ